MQYEEVKELIEIFEKTDLNDMEVQLDNARIRLNRGAVSPWIMPASSVMAAVPQPVAGAPVSPQPVVGKPVSSQSAAGSPASLRPATEAASADVSSVTEKVPAADLEAEGTEVIKAPIVGTFYQSSAPGEDPFVKVGDVIAEGDVVCIIEAMKFMNEVNSELSGTIMEVLVKDGDFVEYGQPLFRVK